MSKKTSPKIYPKLYIIGEINWEAYQQFSEELTELENKNEAVVEVELGSDGGDAQVALAFVSRIRKSLCVIKITGYGNIASAAVIILAAAKHSRITRESWVMVHEEQIEGMSGSATHIEKEGKQLRRLEDQWADLLSQYTNIDRNLWVKLHKDVTYLTADEALKYNLVNEII